MSTIKDRQANAEEDLREQHVIEKKLAKAREAEKSTVEKKKGQKLNWKPASRLPKLEAPEGFVPAWKANTPENVRKCRQEGWVIANRLEHNMDVDMGDYYKKLNDKPVSESESLITHNELIAMLLPDELAEARKEHYRQETEKQTRAKLRPEDDAQNAHLTRAGKIKTTMEIN